MKKHKYKAFDFRSQRNHAKLIFQWVRGGDVEVTLIVLKGEYKYMSGYFAIADTKLAAVQLLQIRCYINRPIGHQEAPQIVPWKDLFVKFS